MAGAAAEVVFVEDIGMRSGNLSATLKKLYMWEKKLYNEVKVCVFFVDLSYFCRRLLGNLSLFALVNASSCY